MGFHRRKHRDRLRLPEYLALFLVACVVASAALWWRAHNHSAWLQTGGRVVEGRVVPSHYNAQPVDPRVELDYTYTAGGMVHRGRWTGFWPVENSPNALPESRYAELFTEGYPLTVYYEAGNPGKGELHRSAGEGATVLAVATVFLAAVTCVYLFRVYPSWRRE